MTRCLTFPVRSWVDPPHICPFGNPQSGYILPESLYSDFPFPDQESRVPPPLSPSHVFSIEVSANSWTTSSPTSIPLNSTTFLLNQIVFGTPQLIQFISRTPSLDAVQNAFVDVRVGASAASPSGHKKIGACRGLMTWEREARVDIYSRAQGRNLPIQPSA